MWYCGISNSERLAIRVKEGIRRDSKQADWHFGKESEVKIPLGLPTIRSCMGSVLTSGWETVFNVSWSCLNQNSNWEEGFGTCLLPFW